jgi:hypothetical protein
MTRLFGAALLALALVAGGCQTASPTTAAGWGQIAAGVGAVLGETKIDPKIEKVSAKLAGYCAEVKTAALAVDLFAPANLQEAASAGRIAVATFCAAPPKNVAEALVTLADAYAAIEAARAGR